jgi:nucleotide-binding universal stress UspA family protein
MKLLIATDFSSDAANAANYGYSLATKLNAHILLCNALIVPAQGPQAGLLVWPMEESAVLLQGGSRKLKHLKAHLEASNTIDGFKPNISCIEEAGLLSDVVNHIIKNHQVDLTIIATHNNKALSSFLLGNHSKNLINDITKPLLLIPPIARCGKVDKIAFATDFEHPKEDLAAIFALVSIARPLNAEILVTHIYDENDLNPKLKQSIDQFMIELSDKADYPHIYYRVVKNSSPEGGLNWLCIHGQIDMLAMVHRKHNFFHNLLQGSHTQKIANFITIPLLVFCSDS